MKAKLLSVIFFICAGLCAVYFGVIIGYSGIGTSMCFVWPVFACMFTAMGMLARNINRHRLDMPRFLPSFVFTSFGLLLAVFAVIMNMVIGASGSAVNRHVDYCIVMGARVYSNGISKTLKYRLDLADELWENYPDTVFVLAGGQEPGDPIPEAFAMYNYLSLSGVPNSSMLLEAKATTTCGIIQSAARAIEADHSERRIPKGPGDRIYPEDYVPKVGIITSDYHMFRSIALAERNGIEDPVPISADSDSVLFVHNCVRESIAILKDFFMGNVTVDEEHIPRIPFNREQTDR